MQGEGGGGGGHYPTIFDNYIVYDSSGCRGRGGGVTTPLYLSGEFSWKFRILILWSLLNM